ncbi:MAG: DNA methyltransferase [Chloroflexi bacterium]|nr:DNA methyltransferase [Chloroflexota bacterium]
MPELNVDNRTIFTRDNLDVLRGINSECIDLIYLDPPFNSGKQWQAPLDSSAAGAVFDDVWTLDDMKEEWVTQIEASDPAVWAIITAAGRAYGESMQAYLTFMCVRLLEMHRVLKSTGSLYLHCDPTVSHYLKSLLDAIFGKQSFRNEVIWGYRGMPSKANKWQAKHDVLLFYARSAGNTFNVQRGDFTEGPMATYQSAMRRGYNANHSRNMVTIFDEEKYRQAVVDGKIPEGMRESYYTGVGPPLRDWWDDIRILGGPQNRERVDYPTQKPLALIERIIAASSNEGDVVLDPFCGCATACIAAEKLNRRWIGIDISDVAWELVNQRMVATSGVGLFGGHHRTDVPARTDQPPDEVSPDIRESLYRSQKGKCVGCGDPMRMRNLEIDHITPRSRGGRHTDSNLQLLCGWCNRTKGNRDMNYLRVRLRQTDE